MSLPGNGYQTERTGQCSSTLSSCVRSIPKTYLVTGDRKLRESVNLFLKGLAITVDEALEWMS
ncbi:hypothetical protein [Geoglobus acetivorans]|uniref:hypothetical protein n=1 Tax=Geoglobus acetivorans TaxID=565033 RepID=UPI00130ED653